MSLLTVLKNPRRPFHFLMWGTKICNHHEKQVWFFLGGKWKHNENKECGLTWEKWRSASLQALNSTLFNLILLPMLVLLSWHDVFVERFFRVLHETHTGVVKLDLLLITQWTPSQLKGNKVIFNQWAQSTLINFNHKLTNIELMESLRTELLKLQNFFVLTCVLETGRSLLWFNSNCLLNRC